MNRRIPLLCLALLLPSAAAAQTEMTAHFRYEADDAMASLYVDTTPETILHTSMDAQAGQIICMETTSQENVKKVLDAQFGGIRSWYAVGEQVFFTTNDSMEGRALTSDGYWFMAVADAGLASQLENLAASVAYIPQTDLGAGDLVCIGSYEQDADRKNGTEPIEWIVLQVERDRALLLSRYVLDTHWYHNHNIRVSWHDCESRAWLNSEFLDAAFTPEEQKDLLVTQTDRDCLDKVFFITAREADTLLTEKTRRGPATAYCKTRRNVVLGSGNTIWWMRSELPGIQAPFGMTDGRIHIKGNNVKKNHVGIRPAIWLDLTGKHWEKIEE